MFFTVWESMIKGGFFSSQTTNKSEQDLADPLGKRHELTNHVLTCYRNNFTNFILWYRNFTETSGGNDLGSASNNVEEIATPPGSYVIGPMVVRVMPDGRPVPGDSQRPLPKDEDAEEFIAMRSKPMPTMMDMFGQHKQLLQPTQNRPVARRPFRYTLKPINWYSSNYARFSATWYSFRCHIYFLFICKKEIL